MTITKEQVIALADAFAQATATFTLEHFYGTSKSYTAEKQREGNEARAALLEAVEQLAGKSAVSEPALQDGWVSAADEAMTSAHIGVANQSDSYESAKAKLASLIDWHIAVATDPAVNGGLSLQPTAAVSEPVLTGCACRWDANDKRVATCVRHQGWLDVVSEWADRAKEAEAKLRTPPAEAKREPLTDEKIKQLAAPLFMSHYWKLCNEFARAVEAAHGIVNIGAKE